MRNSCFVLCVHAQTNALPFPNYALCLQPAWLSCPSCRRCATPQRARPSRSCKSTRTRHARCVNACGYVWAIVCAVYYSVSVLMGEILFACTLWLGSFSVYGTMDTNIPVHLDFRRAAASLCTAILEIRMMTPQPLHPRLQHGASDK